MWYSLFKSPSCFKSAEGGFFSQTQLLKFKITLSNHFTGNMLHNFKVLELSFLKHPLFIIFPNTKILEKINLTNIMVKIAKPRRNILLQKNQICGFMNLTLKIFLSFWADEFHCFLYYINFISLMILIYILKSIFRIKCTVSYNSMYMNC